MGAGSLHFSNCVILKACRFPEPIDDYRAMALFPRPPLSEFTHHRWEAVSGFSFRATPLDPRIQVLHI